MLLFTKKNGVYHYGAGTGPVDRDGRTEEGEQVYSLEISGQNPPPIPKQVLTEDEHTAWLESITASGCTFREVPLNDR